MGVLFLFYAMKIVKQLFKRLLYLLGAVILIVFLLLGGFILKYKMATREVKGELQVSLQPGELGKYVNPFIGTGGYPWVCGHNFPGAAQPFGIMRLSPDTHGFIGDLLGEKALNTSGYYYGDNRIIGFSHTRLSGTGATDGGHFRIIPGEGEEIIENYFEGKYIPFSHRDEKAFPGYYAVKLHNPDVLSEFTTTMRTGIHKYTFIEGRQPCIMIDVSSALGDRKTKEGIVRIIPDASEIEGAIRAFGTFGGRYGGEKIYFIARFSKAFKEYSTWKDGVIAKNQKENTGDNVGAVLVFEKTSASFTVEIRLSVSHVSIANARHNLETETNGKSFEDVLEEAKQAWEEKLSLIRLQNDTPDQQTIFYTAMYRSFLMPTLFEDVNGDYFGFDKQVHNDSSGHYYTDLSLWDTFRTLHPLYTLIAREEQQDMVNSLVKMKEQGGWLPRWPSGNGYTGSMLGSPADMVIAESWLKGIRGFDVESAYEGMKEIALGPTPKGSACSGRRGIAGYLEYDYCPSDLMDESVSKTLEYAWADQSIANLARGLGKEEDTQLFESHAQHYRNTWNPETKYFQPRDVKGNFFEPFKPLLLTYLDWDDKYTDDYVEGSALQWRWCVPQDPQGLIELFGSREYFVEELNDFFAKADPDRGTFSPGSYYWHGNEPDMHAAYLFNSAGRPDLTQKWVRWILDNKYGTGPAGIDGNDDGATLSAWYILSAMGFYPIAGSDKYELGAPLFERAIMDLGESKLEIIAENYSPGNIYAQKIRLNDTLLDRTWIWHSEIARGGVLKFEMTDKPLPD